MAFEPCRQSQRIQNHVRDEYRCIHSIHTATTESRPVPVLPLVVALILTASTARSLASAEPTRAVSLVNYAFQELPSQDVRPRSDTELWTIRNESSALHQLQILRLRDSSHLADVDAWIARGAPALLPPAPLIANVAALLPGASVQQRVRLEPGLHVVLCFVPAGRDSTGTIVSHAHLGMRQTFVVQD